MTLALFFFTQLSNYTPSAFAQSSNFKVQGGNPVKDLPRLARDVEIRIPPELGLIDESFHGASKKTMIYLQDAHDSLEAQENISKIINHLVSNYGVKTVFEEGYEGPVPTDKYFGFIKDPKIKEKVSYFLMDHLRVGGAEYAHINRTKDFDLMGADSFLLHRKNIDQYRLSAERKEAITKDLKTLEKELKSLTDDRFPKPLKEWLKVKEQFDAKRLDLFTYLGRTMPLLVKRDAEKSKGLMGFILEAIRSSDPAVIEKARHIDAREVFSELSKLEKAVADTYLHDASGQRLFEYSKILGLLHRLNELQVSQEEYAAVRTSLKAFDTESFAQFIFSQAPKTLILSRMWERNIGDAVRFYEIAQERDHSLAQILHRYSVGEIKKEKGSLKSNICDPDVSILVFGGFHKEAIKHILEAKGISYLIVSPRIMKPSPLHEAYYKRLMTNGHHAFEIPFLVSRATRPLPLIAEPESVVRAEIWAVFDAVRLHPAVDVRLLSSYLVVPHNVAQPVPARSEIRDEAGSPFISGMTSVQSQRLRDFLHEVMAIYDIVAGTPMVIETKDDKTPATVADYLVQIKTMLKLRELGFFPSDIFLGEEKSDAGVITEKLLQSAPGIRERFSKDIEAYQAWRASRNFPIPKTLNVPSDFIWILDPLDGTRSFIAGRKHYAFSLARARWNREKHIYEVVYSLVFAPGYETHRGVRQITSPIIEAVGGQGVSLYEKKKGQSDFTLVTKNLKEHYLGRPQNVPFVLRDSQTLGPNPYTAALRSQPGAPTVINEWESSVIGFMEVALGNLAGYHSEMSIWDHAAADLILSMTGQKVLHAQTGELLQGFTWEEIRKGFEEKHFGVMATQAPYETLVRKILSSVARSEVRWVPLDHIMALRRNIWKERSSQIIEFGGYFQKEDKTWHFLSVFNRETQNIAKQMGYASDSSARLNRSHEFYGNYHTHPEGDQPSPADMYNQILIGLESPHESVIFAPTKTLRFFNRSPLIGEQPNSLTELFLGLIARMQKHEALYDTLRELGRSFPGLYPNPHMVIFQLIINLFAEEMGFRSFDDGWRILSNYFGFDVQIIHHRDDGSIEKTETFRAITDPKKNSLERWLPKAQSIVERLNNGEAFVDALFDFYMPPVIRFNSRVDSETILTHIMGEIYDRLMKAGEKDLAEYVLISGEKKYKALLGPSDFETFDTMLSLMRQLGGYANLRAALEANGGDDPSAKRSEIRQGIDPRHRGRIKQLLRPLTSLPQIFPSLNFSERKGVKNILSSQPTVSLKGFRSEVRKSPEGEHGAISLAVLEQGNSPLTPRHRRSTWIKPLHDFTVDRIFQRYQNEKEKISFAWFRSIFKEFFVETFSEKFFSLLKLKENIKSLWRQLNEYGRDFVIFVVAYNILEDYLASPILLLLKMPLLATFVFFGHFEWIVYPTYLVVRQKLKKLFKKHLRPAEKERLRLFLRSKLSEAAGIRGRWRIVKKLLWIHPHLSKLMNETLLQTSDPEDISSVTRISIRELYFKCVGRVLRDNGLKSEDSHRGFELILRGLENPQDLWVRKVCAGSIGKFASKLNFQDGVRAYDALIKRLAKEQEPVVREAIFRTLGTFPFEPALEILSAAVLDQTRGFWPQKYAAESIGNVLERLKLDQEVPLSPVVLTAVQALLAQLDFHRQTSVEVRVAAVDSLARLREDMHPELERLRELINGDLLTALREDPDPTVREHALWAIARHSVVEQDVGGERTREFEKILEQAVDENFVNVAELSERYLRYIYRTRPAPFPKRLKTKIQKVLARSRIAKPVIFIAVDALFEEGRGRASMLASPRVEAFVKNLRESKHMVLYARNFLLDRNRSAIQPDGSIAIFDDFDRVRFANVIERLRKGRPAHVPWIDFARGVVASTRTLIPNPEGCLVCIGSSKSLHKLAGAIDMQSRQIWSAEPDHLSEILDHLRKLSDKVSAKPFELTLVPVVDSTGHKVLGEKPLVNAHLEGDRHLRSAVFVVTLEGKVLRQHKTDKMTSEQNKYDISARAHVSKGETLASSATQVLSEKLGLNVPESELIRVGPENSLVRDQAHDREFVTVWVHFLRPGVLPKASAPDVGQLDEKFSFEELISNVQSHPDQYSKIMQDIANAPEVIRNMEAVLSARHGEAQQRSEVRADSSLSRPRADQKAEAKPIHPWEVLRLWQEVIVVVEQARIDALSPAMFKELLMIAGLNRGQLHVVIPDGIPGAYSGRVAELQKIASVRYGFPQFAASEKIPVIGFSDMEHDTLPAFQKRLGPKLAGRMKDSAFGLNQAGSFGIGILYALKDIPADQLLPNQNGFRYDRSGRFASQILEILQSYTVTSISA